MRSMSVSLAKSGGITQAHQVMRMTAMSLSTTAKTTGTSAHWPELLALMLECSLTH